MKDHDEPEAGNGRPLFFHIDANCVNARQREEALNGLEHYYKQGKVVLEYAETAYREASHGSKKRSEKASLLTWTESSNKVGVEEYWRQRIAAAVFPAGVETASDRNDIEILLAVKLSGAILITSDGNSRTQPRGILGSARELLALGIRVMRPIDALRLVERTLSTIYSVAQ